MFLGPICPKRQEQAGVHHSLNHGRILFDPLNIPMANTLSLFPFHSTVSFLHVQVHVCGGVVKGGVGRNLLLILKWRINIYIYASFLCAKWKNDLCGRLNKSGIVQVTSLFSVRDRETGSDRKQEQLQALVNSHLLSSHRSQSLHSLYSVSTISTVHFKYNLILSMYVWHTENKNSRKKLNMR